LCDSGDITWIQTSVKHLATRQAALSSYTLFSPLLPKQGKIYWWQNVISAAGYRIVLSCCDIQRLIAVSLFFSDGTKLGYKKLHLHYVETTFPSGSGI